MTTHNHSTPDRSPPGSTRTAPFAVHQDGGVKYATGASSKIRGKDNITIGTWNTRTLRATGKLQELTHEMDRYRWNITIVQAYVPTSDYDDNKIEFYEQLQDVIDQTPKKDILVVQGDWNAKVGMDACGNWQGICGPFCNDDTNERGLRLLESATFNNLVLANTFGHHKASRRWT